MSIVIKCFGEVEHERTRFGTVAESIDYEVEHPCAHRHASFRRFDEPLGEARPT